jgi:predicted RND superfamily exporter protein
MTRKEALDAITGGVAAALISAVVTVIAVTYSIYQNIDDGIFRLLNDWVSYLDVVLLLVLAFFLNRKSRFAGVLLVLFYVLNKVIFLQVMDMQNIRVFTIILPLIFLYFFVKSAYAAFIFHRIEKQENSDYKKPSKKTTIYFFADSTGNSDSFWIWHIWRFYL